MDAYSFTPPWVQINAFLDATGAALVRELVRETGPRHVLYGRDVTAVARCENSDHVLFAVGDPPSAFAVVNLTYSGEREDDPALPETEFYDSFDAFARAHMPVRRNGDDPAAVKDAESENP